MIFVWGGLWGDFKSYYMEIIKKIEYLVWI